MFNTSADNQFAVDAVREISALVALKGHPNIIQILGFCLQKGQSYIVMESGEMDLYSALKGGLNGAGGDTLVAKRIMFQILNGLNYMNSIGLWHRDVKQQNVIVFPGGVVKLCDFSVARGGPFNGVAITNTVHSLWYVKTFLTIS